MSKPKTPKSKKIESAPEIDKPLSEGAARRLRGGSTVRNIERKETKAPRGPAPTQKSKAEMANGDPFEKGYALLLAQRVPVDAVELGRAYVIHARRGGVGVAVGFDDDGASRLGYRIHREKWGDHYLFTEWDWAEGEPHGTAIPLRVIDAQPPTADKKLLAWLRVREVEHRDEIRAAFKVVFGERITITEPVSGERGKVAVPKKSTKAKRTAKSTKKGGPCAPEFLALMGSLDEDIERPPQTPITTAIYTVTAIGGRLASRRTWGWHPTRETAEEAMRRDAALLFEDGMYQHAVIEQVPPGLVWASRSAEAWWFRADRQDGDVYVIAALEIPPDFAENVFNFAMG